MLTGVAKVAITWAVVLVLGLVVRVRRLAWP
jgi:hypothetical protein